MLLITKRRQIGAICGHTIYAVTKSEMIPLPNPAVQPDAINSKNEDRLFSTLLDIFQNELDVVNFKSFWFFWFVVHSIWLSWE